MSRLAYILAVCLLVLVAWSDLANFWKLSAIENAVLGSEIDEPITLENRIVNPTCYTRTKTVNGEQHSMTWYQGTPQNPDETWSEFLERMDREWKAFCEAIGG